MQIPNEIRRLMRRREAAEYCNRAVSTMDKERIRGDGPPYIKAGRTVLYCLEDLDGWLAARRRSSTSDTGDAR